MSEAIPVIAEEAIHWIERRGGWVSRDDDELHVRYPDGRMIPDLIWQILREQKYVALNFLRCREAQAQTGTIITVNPRENRKGKMGRRRGAKTRNQTPEFLADAKSRLDTHQVGTARTAPYWRLTDAALVRIAAIQNLAAALAWLRKKMPAHHRQLHGEWPERIAACVGVVSLKRFEGILNEWVKLHREVARDWFELVGSMNADPQARTR